jgi:ATP-binding cassette subfamily B protein
MRTGDRLLWLEDYVASQTSATEPPPNRLREGIRISGLGFTYPGAPAPSLHDVDLFFPAGGTVALVGENGAGKTTLVKLLSGMYRPTVGSIAVDGHELAEMDVISWRARTSATFQDYVSYQMRLGDGVGVGDLPELSNHAVVNDAIARADATKVVDVLPDGIDTVVGPYVGGRGLSGGQWQRLALARGLMRPDPLLMVLDEPTASLDALSEATLFRRYRAAASDLGARHGTITVLVSHRFSTVNMADLIVVFEGGRVVASGTHETLVAEGGLYAELYQLQVAGYQPGEGAPANPGGRSP